MMGRDSARFGTIMICFLIGFIFALMLQLFYAHSIILNELVYGTITLRVIQFFVMFMFTLFGVVLAAAQK